MEAIQKGNSEHLIPDQDNKNLADTVKTSQGNYRVVVGNGVIRTLGQEMKRAELSGRVFLIVDKNVFSDGVHTVHEILEAEGFKTNVLSLELNEVSKNIDTVRTIYGWLAKHKAERLDTIIGFGGGVTGDVTGFVAATWLRGVPFIQLPTTLAAMVDASIGGKVAVNLSVGKNLIGAFYQPKLVLQDIDYLKTLPKRELTSGWAEAIKHGLINNLDLLKIFERRNTELTRLDPKTTATVVRKSVQIKSQIVTLDEFERGNNRILLNYGHTVGHAIENVTKYERYLHGEAVSVGMMAAGTISYLLGMISKDVLKRQESLLKSYDLPLKVSKVTVDQILGAIQMDKKTRDGSVKWVILKQLGIATTKVNVPKKIVLEAIQSIID